MSEQNKNSWDFRSKHFWTDGWGSLFLAVFIALFIRWGFIEAYVIPSGSMLPSLLIHDHIFVNKLVYGIRAPFSENWLVKFNEPKRGEVIVFKYPKDMSTFFIKRVVGLPGEHLKVINGRAWINGKPLKEPYIRPDPSCEICDLPREITIPPGYFFMMGDNRGESDDSRTWGPVPKKWIIGKAFFTYWPPKRIGTL